MVHIDELKCCGVFADLNDRELAEVAKLGTIEKRGAGSPVIAEGTQAAALYLLQEGRVTVRMSSRDGHEVIIDQLGPGDVFGWSAVLDQKTFRAGIWAVEDCMVIVLDGAKLKALLDANNHIGYRVLRVIAGIVAGRLENLRVRLVDQPFSKQWLAPTRSTPIITAGAKSEMRNMPCPECAKDNEALTVVNETVQYRCRQCGMVYYSPLGCETGPITPGADRE
jgi:CRP/FNR family transcriptional regulator, cyclic AMP receptor protein